MDTKRKNVFLLASAILVVAALVAMVTVTALTARSDRKEWRYEEQTESLDYYRYGGSDEDFQYVANFKNAIVTYFGSLISDRIAQYIDLESQLESQLGGFADKVVKAMSDARVSSAKLNRIADCLKTNSIESIFRAIPRMFSEIKDVDELQAALENYLTENAPVNVLARTLRRLMDETALTETEIAKFLYYYLSDNASETYRTYLSFMGESFFEDFVANTIYTLSTIENVRSSAYQTAVTAYSMQSVLYQLGSMYVSIASLRGGAETMERVFMWTWDYDENAYENAARLNELSGRIRGKLGELLVYVGYFMRSVTSDELTAYLSYYGKTDERTDEKIYAAQEIAKTLERSFSSAQRSDFMKYDSFKDVCAAYSSLSADLRSLSAAVFPSDEEEEEEEIVEVVGRDVFGDLAEAAAYYEDKTYTIDEIRAMDREAEPYRELSAQADKLLGVGEGFSAIISNVIMIWLGNGLAETE